MSVVIQTLTTLWNGGMKPLSLRLMLEVWRVDQRSYPFLAKFLNETTTEPDLSVAKAYVAVEVCKERSVFLFMMTMSNRGDRNGYKKWKSRALGVS